MIRYFFNILAFFSVSFYLLRRVALQRSFNKRVLVPVMEESKRTQDTTLDAGDYRKMIVYYGISIPVLFGASFGILRGKKLNSTERTTLTYLAAMTGLFDDFFDKWNTPETRIMELIDNPPGLPVSSSNEKLFIRLNTLVLQGCADERKLKQEALNVYRTQLKSKRQEDKGTLLKELETVILEKGGCSPLLYRAAIHPALPEEEREVLFKLGGMYQLVNDLFDCYKDHTEGIHTLVTRETDIAHLRAHYLRHLQDLFSSVKKTRLPARAKRRFIRIHMPLLSRGFICLDMLERNQKSSGNVFDIALYSRKQLICDMEKPVNLLKNLHYFARYTP